MKKINKNNIIMEEKKLLKSFGVKVVGPGIDGDYEFNDDLQIVELKKVAYMTKAGDLAYNGELFYEAEPFFDDLAIVNADVAPDMSKERHKCAAKYTFFHKDGYYPCRDKRFVSTFGFSSNGTAVVEVGRGVYKYMDKNFNYLFGDLTFLECGYFENGVSIVGMMNKRKRFATIEGGFLFDGKEFCAIKSNFHLNGWACVSYEEDGLLYANYINKNQEYLFKDIKLKYAQPLRWHNPSHENDWLLVYVDGHGYNYANIKGEFLFKHGILNEAKEFDRGYALVNIEGVTPYGYFSKINEKGDIYFLPLNKENEEND